jgi:hypothetical protein
MNQYFAFTIMETRLPTTPECAFLESRCRAERIAGINIPREQLLAYGGEMHCRTLSSPDHGSAMMLLPPITKPYAAKSQPPTKAIAGQYIIVINLFTDQIAMHVLWHKISIA